MPTQDDQPKRLYDRLLGRIPNKRLMVARLGGALGILRLLEVIVARLKPVIVVLTYHRIAVPGDPALPYYEPVVSATPEAFEAQIHLLAQRFQVLSLEELLQVQVGGEGHKHLKKSAVLITFDDGYRDNFVTALPILQSYRVPATFFIPTGFLENPGLPWWDHVAYVLNATNVSAFRLERFEGDNQPLDIRLGRCPSAQDRARAIQVVVGHFINGSISDQPWFLDQLIVEARVAIDTQAAGYALFMGWDEVRQLSLAGMSIGSHGHSHLALGKLDEASQRLELTTSRVLLEKRTGKEVRALAYPFGWNLTYSTRTQELAAEVGYRLGFSSMEGVNEPVSLWREPMTLRRLNVGRGDSPSLLRARVLSYTTLGVCPSIRSRNPQVSEIKRLA